jgi:hypothetical protein
MSANEFDNCDMRWLSLLVSARATTETGALLCDTAKAAIKPPPIEAATSVKIAVVRRNWTTLDMFLLNPFNPLTFKIEIRFTL